jgi:Rho-binding antiterminator
MKPVISCAAHDHLEVACLFAYCLKVELNDGSTVIGRAITTRISEHQEFLVINREGKETSLPLKGIVRIRCLTEGARFTVVEFNEPLI